MTKTRTLQEIFTLCIENGHLASEMFMCFALKEAVKAGTITQKECDKATKSIYDFFHYCSGKYPILRGAGICTVTTVFNYLAMVGGLTQKGQRFGLHKSAQTVRVTLFSAWADRYSYIVK